jgi:ribose transport system ATP-binding protein
MDNAVTEQSEDLIVRMTDIRKSFPGVQALKGVDFELRRGEVHAVVGENGAGKSTLMKILMGAYMKDSGTIEINGEAVEIHGPDDAHRQGMAMIFQELSLVPQLSVAANIYLQNEPRGFAGLLNDRVMNKAAEDLARKYGVDKYFKVKDRISGLSRGNAQIVEVLKALSLDAKVLVMDEPTASLTKDEEDTLYQIITNLKNQGVSIIYISHRMEEIFRNCDRVTVFRDGEKITTQLIQDINMDQLIEFMTGRKLDSTSVHHGSVVAPGEREPILRVEDLRWGSRLNGITFDVNYGEVVGVTGLMGSGKSETARAIFGIDPPESGRILIDGEEVKIKNPVEAIKAGMALVPEDRRNQGLVTMISVAANVELPLVNILNVAGWVKKKEAQGLIEEQVRSLQIKTPSIKQLVKNLSGGNQQKVVVGKWLNRKPRLLILDEPTVGVDVKTKSELRGIIRKLVSSGDRGALVFSSELKEVIDLADRIIVLYRGRVLAEIDNREPIAEDVLHRAVQGIIGKEVGQHE